MSNKDVVCNEECKEAFILNFSETSLDNVMLDNTLEFIQFNIYNYLKRWLRYSSNANFIYKNSSSMAFISVLCTLYNIDYDIEKYYDDDGFTKKGEKLKEKDIRDIFKKIFYKIKQPRIRKNNKHINKLNLIKELYNLQDNQINMITWAFISTIGKFDILLSFIINGTSSPFLLQHIICDFKDNISRRTINEKLKFPLSEIGILENDSSSPCLTYLFDDILKNDDIKTKEQLINELIGQKENKSDLTLKDFKHVEYKTVLKILSKSIKNRNKGTNILLYGDVGTGKTEFSKVITERLNINLYPVITELDHYKEAKREDRLVDLRSKLSILKNTNNNCILFDEAEDVMNRGFTEDGTSSKGYMNRLLENNELPIIWTTNNIWNVDPAFLRRMTYCIEFKSLTEKQRLNIWKNVLKKNDLKVSNKKIKELNQSYEIPAAIISNAIETTKLINGDENDFGHLVENVAKVVTKKKEVKKEKDIRLDNYDLDLVNTDIDINNLTERIKSCGKLNFSLCMYGEPGTGKSLYARYLAKELGIEVIQKRASDLMSMWVGETEHNIANAFSEAKSKKAMLIFDEADSFLQNRQTAERQWEITQVNEMLTWMENHQYPFICTTNLMDNLDEASLRRFTFKLEFKFMNREQVKKALKHFFNFDSDEFIKGLTAGDFATVKKRVDFLEVKDEQEILKMLQEEVKVKKSKSLQNTIGF